VAEAAVVGRPDDLKGQAISAFVSLESGYQPSEELKDELRKWVSKEIGSLARPDDIRFTEALPKTRSGKIMRRLLRDLATHGEIKGDTTTLEDFAVISKMCIRDSLPAFVLNIRAIHDDLHRRDAAQLGRSVLGDEPQPAALVRDPDFLAFKRLIHKLEEILAELRDRNFHDFRF